MSNDQNQARQSRDPLANREPGDDADERATEPNPRVWASNAAAGAECLTRKEPYEFLIRFKEKPSPEVTSHLKDQGFHWSREEQLWVRPIGYKTAAQDREIGHRAYGTVVNMILGQEGQVRQPF